MNWTDYVNIPVKYQDAVIYLKMFFEVPTKNELRMEELFKK